MQFEVRFYYTRDKSKPLKIFLEDLRQADPVLHKLVVKGLEKLKDSDRHGPPLTAWADRKLQIYELRVGSANIARVFFYFRPGQVIMATNGYVKKSKKVDSQELELARQYKRDWEERFR